MTPFGSGRSRSAPAATRLRAHSRQPSRAANSSGVKPPNGRYMRRGSPVTWRGQSLTSGARVDLGAVLDEQLHHRGLVLRRGPHQRRLLAPALARVDVGAMLR